MGRKGYLVDRLSIVIIISGLLLFSTISSRAQASTCAGLFLSLNSQTHLTSKFYKRLIHGKPIPTYENILKNHEQLKAEANVVGRSLEREAKTLSGQSLSIFKRWSSNSEASLSRVEEWELLNTKLYDGRELTRSEIEFKSFLERGLSSLPNLDPKVMLFRAVDMPIGATREQFVPGETYINKAFMSTTIKLNYAYELLVAPIGTEPVLFVIRGVSGKAIFPHVHKSHYGEYEVLFAPGISWKVDAVYGTRAPEVYPNVVVLTEKRESQKKYRVRGQQGYPVRGIPFPKHSKKSRWFF